MQVGSNSTQLVHKCLIFKVYGLQQWQTLRHGILLHRRLQQVMTTARWFVGHSDHGCYMKSCFHKPLEALHGKVGSAEKHNLQVFFLHL